MKAGGGEVCGREAAIREPGTFDMQKTPAPLIALAGLVPKQAPSLRYQELLKGPGPILDANDPAIVDLEGRRIPKSPPGGSRPGWRQKGSQAS